MDAMGASRDFSTGITDAEGTLLAHFTAAGNYSEFSVSVNFSEDELQYDASNITFHTSNWRVTYKPVLDFLLLLSLIVIMFTMGCDITWKNLYCHIKRPFGICIGMISQFGVLPLSAYSILRISGIRGLHATGVLLISCCPGGVISNIFTYFLDGDLPLSVGMTAVSTVVAMGMMPLNVWLYGRYFESDNLVIPYVKMSITLIMVTSPVLVGMLLKWKFPRVAALATKLGSVCGLLIIGFNTVMQIIIFPGMFAGVSAKEYVIMLSLPPIGVTLGYGFAAVTKRNIPVRKAISIECGIQNVPLSLTVISLSFPLEMQQDIVLVPCLYGFCMIISCSVICLTYQVCKKYFPNINTENDTGTTVSNAPLLEDIEKQDSLTKVEIGIKPCNVKNGKLNSLNSNFPNGDERFLCVTCKK